MYTGRRLTQSGSTAAVPDPLVHSFTFKRVIV
jgi:hypothetical protein